MPKPEVVAARERRRGMVVRAGQLAQEAVQRRWPGHAVGVLVRGGAVVAQTVPGRVVRDLERNSVHVVGPGADF